MRIAFVAGRIPDRAELAIGPIDSAWLVELSQDNDLVVLVDHETPGSQHLRDAGIPVHASPKRESGLPDGSVLSADEVQARHLALVHSQDPLDAIIYDSEMTTDYSWFEPSLGSVRRGVALGGGFTGSLTGVLSDPALFQHFGRAAWSRTGNLAGADFLVSDVPGSAFGYVDGRLPITLGTGSLDDVKEKPAEPGPGLLTVVALTEDPIGLFTLVERAAASCKLDASTTIAVIHRDIRIGADAARDLILGGCPADLADAVILATPDLDGVAASLLAKSDQLVVASVSDLAARAVADAAVEGVVLLSGEVPRMPGLESMPAHKAAPPEAALLPVSGPLSETAEMLANLEEGMDLDYVILHAPGFSGEALRLLGHGGLSGADLAVLAYPEPTYGAPLPDLPCLSVLAVHRSAWPSMRRWLRQVGSIEELVIWSLSVGLTEHVRLLVLPGSDRGCVPLPAQNVLGIPAWLASNGLLPRPNFAGVGTSAEGPAPAASGQGIRDWIQSHSWKQRASLALPWRWGLLEKAMKDMQ